MKSDFHSTPIESYGNGYKANSFTKVFSLHFSEPVEDILEPSTDLNFNLQCITSEDLEERHSSLVTAINLLQNGKPVLDFDQSFFSGLVSNLSSNDSESVWLSLCCLNYYFSLDDLEISERLSEGFLPKLFTLVSVSNSKQILSFVLDILSKIIYGHESTSSQLEGLNFYESSLYVANMYPNNADCQISALNLLGSAIAMFSMPGNMVDDIIGWLASSVNSSTTQIKKAALNCLISAAYYQSKITADIILDPRMLQCILKFDSEEALELKLQALNNACVKSAELSTIVLSSSILGCSISSNNKSLWKSYSKCFEICLKNASLSSITALQDERIALNIKIATTNCKNAIESDASFSVRKNAAVLLCSLLDNVSISTLADDIDFFVDSLTQAVEWGDQTLIEMCKKAFQKMLSYTETTGRDVFGFDELQDKIKLASVSMFE